MTKVMIDTVAAVLPPPPGTRPMNEDPMFCVYNPMPSGGMRPGGRHLDCPVRTAPLQDGAAAAGGGHPMLRAQKGHTALQAMPPGP